MLKQITQINKNLFISIVIFKKMEKIEIQKLKKTIGKLGLG